MKLTGLSLEMSLSENQSASLWRKFMSEILSKGNQKPAELISLQNYPADYFKSFNPHKNFRKFAAVEIKYLQYIPDTFESMELPSSLYAVFHYKGLNTDPAIFQYIYQQWLPSSGYQLNNRPHFEVLGNKYKNGDPESEENIYIPVKLQF